MKVFNIRVLSALALFFNFGQAQFIGFEDAPTHRGNIEKESATFEGLVVEKYTGATPDEKDITITFILTDLPTAFFDYYDDKRKAIILDLYDVKMGESAIDSLKEHPILGNVIEETQIDLNKDVVGLKEDMRDVIRITLFSNFNFEYDVEEEFGVITMKFKWSRKIEKKLKRSKSSIYWKFPLATAILAGGGYYAYKTWIEKPIVEEACPVCEINGGVVPSHPSP